MYVTRRNARLDFNSRRHENQEKTQDLLVMYSSKTQGIKLWEESLLLGLRVCDLVDHQSNAALGDDIGNAITNLNGDNGRCGVDAEHRDQVHHWVCAPANHRHHLRRLDFRLDC